MEVPEWNLLQHRRQRGHAEVREGEPGEPGDRELLREGVSPSQATFGAAEDE
jgi:hypothetical protein